MTCECKERKKSDELVNVWLCILLVGVILNYVLKEVDVFKTRLNFLSKRVSGAYDHIELVTEKLYESERDKEVKTDG